MRDACHFAIDAAAAAYGGFFLGVFFAGVVLLIVRMIAAGPHDFRDGIEHFPSERIDP